MLWQHAIRMRPTSAINSIEVNATTRSQMFNILAIGIVHAALTTLVTISITVNREWPWKSLVMYGDKFAVKLPFKARTKYINHMLLPPRC